MQKQRKKQPLHCTLQTVLSVETDVASKKVAMRQGGKHKSQKNPHLDIKLSCQLSTASHSTQMLSSERTLNMIVSCDMN